MLYPLCSWSYTVGCKCRKHGTGSFVEEEECAGWHDMQDTLGCVAGQLCIHAHSAEASLCRTAGGVL